MNPENYTTADGWPGVRWVQEFPTGESVAGVRRRRRWMFGIFMGLVVGVLAGWYGWALVAAVLVGVLATAVIVAPDAWRGLSVDLGTYGATRPLEPTEDERAAQARAKVMPGYAREARWAEVRLPKGSKRLVFAAGTGRKSEEAESFAVPLLSFDGFELASAEEWFGDAAQRGLEKLDQAPTQWVILVVTKGFGVQTVARSGRSKAEMAELHQLLIEAFIGARRTLAQRADTLSEGIEGDAGVGPLPDRARIAARVEADRIRQALAGRQGWADRLSGNWLIALLLRGAGRLRDGIVAWALGLVAVMVFLGWVTGAYQNRSWLEIFGLQDAAEYYFNRPVYDKRMAEAAAKRRKKDLDKQLQTEAERLKNVVHGIQAATLPRRCPAGHGAWKGVDDFVDAYEGLLGLWRQVEGNARLDTRYQEQTETVMRARLAQGEVAGVFHLGWVVEMLGKRVSRYDSSSYYPPRAAAVREGLRSYVEAICGRRENWQSRQ